ncbi:MAG: succinate dehydrogenase, cytochrome b556 subunit [Alphaproteobacteria bacterium]
MSPSADAKVERPLSPHLTIYKPQLTSVLSIFHRMTGVALACGLVIFVWWLVSLAKGPESYAGFVTCSQSIVGQVVLFGLTVAFFYHLSCGIRHLLWDTGLFLELKETYKTGRIVLAATVIMTAIVWLKAYGVFL